MSDASLVKTGGAGTLEGSELEQQLIMFHNSMIAEVLRNSCRSETARVWARFPASQCPGVFDRSYFSCLKLFQVKSDLILHEKHTLKGSNASLARFLISGALLWTTSAFVIITLCSLTSGFYCPQTIDWT